MDNEELYRNLVIFLKMFKNRPYHLAKHLVENSALNEEFLKKLLENPRISDMEEDKLPAIYFADIDKMNEYYNSLTEEKRQRSPLEVEMDLNERLESLIEEERYEEAARLRDYMQRNKIKRGRG